MKTITLVTISIFLFAISLAAQTPIPLWPDGAPNAIGKEPQDIPTITPFVAPKETATGASVLVLPGGGYTRLSDVKEGSDIAKWLNSLGISAFVLKYRLGPRYNQPNPLLDAARAMRTVRARSKEFGVDSNRIAILGFSAGGHLASTLGTHFDAGKADARDEIDRMSSRPDAMILLYPVITMGEFTHAGSKKYLLGENPTPELIKLYSNELQVTKETPPTFIMHTMTDASVPVENAMLFAAALRKNSVPFEFHLYEQGPHGVGLAPTNPYLASWAARCADWLVLRGFLKR
ncbi:MAG TPA: alpha/beta hydrolase [Pyrinomonadaceae bacterium]|nr:alpha/beta hydrolase [Acidobacteriota bacterium]HQZ97452.1 alpha/beta hydrolase [Pyrinomonadaceae bacterium]